MTVTADADESTMDAAVRGQRVSRLERVYAEHAPEAGRLAYLLVGDRHLAEDLVQEAFVRAAGRFEHIRDADSVGAYLRRTIVNLSRGHWRRLGVERRHLSKDRQNVGAGHLPDIETRAELRSALARLSHRQRTAVVLRYYADLSEQQTAEAMGCSIGAVKSLVHRGVLALRAHMEGEQHE